MPRFTFSFSAARRTGKEKPLIYWYHAFS